MGQPLPMIVSFIVVPFSRAHDGALVRGRAHNVRNCRQAVAAASRMSRYRAGVMVVEQHGNPLADVGLEPRLVARFGRVPAEAIELLAA